MGDITGPGWRDVGTGLYHGGYLSEAEFVRYISWMRRMFEARVQDVGYMPSVQAVLGEHD